LHNVIVGDLVAFEGENGGNTVASKSNGRVVHDTLNVVFCGGAAGFALHVIAAIKHIRFVEVNTNVLVSVRSALLVVEAQGMHKLMLNGGWRIHATRTKGQPLLATDVTHCGLANSFTSIVNFHVISIGFLDFLECDTVSDDFLKIRHSLSNGIGRSSDVGANEIVESVFRPLVRGVSGGRSKLARDAGIVGKEKIFGVSL